MKICLKCGSNKAEKGKKLCSSCRKKPWQKHKKSHCECCGFIPTHQCQLDVDHIDGDKNNNQVSNLKTLCANCHRLKTMLNSDYLNKYLDEDVSTTVLHLQFVLL